MEICYYWIDKFNVIEKQGYNFGSDLIFNYNYDSKVLKISENKLYIEGFFNLDNKNRIKNVTAICGENGVGKSTFLGILKMLLKERGIPYKKNGKNLNYNKRILVVKSDKDYKIIFHQDLLSSKSIEFENEELENNYAGKVKLINYGDEKQPKKLATKNVQELAGFNGTDVFSDTSCIYFSHAFDTNFYYDSTELKKSYFDISTKGILNEIEEGLKPFGMLARRQPNHLNFRDERFSVGVLKEFYIRETKKRINFLKDDSSIAILENLNFSPKKVTIKLDYLLHRENKSEYDIDDIPTSQLLRSEGMEQNYNKIELEFKKYINNLNKSLDEPFGVVKQTYLRRVIDSYFYDAERFLFFKLEGMKESIEKESTITIKNDQDLIRALCQFQQIVSKEMTNLINDNPDGNLNINDFHIKEFKKLTNSYIKFIKFFNEELLKDSPIINFKNDTVLIVDTDNAGVRSSRRKSAKIIEISLESKKQFNNVSKGIELLGEIVNKYDSIDTTSNFLKIQWEGLSTGEDTILSIYSRFYNLKSFELKKNLIILLDEIEHSLHPEWQRNLLDNLIGYLPNVFTESESIQIVLATNVPFLIADIPTRNVVYLEKKKNEENKKNKENKEAKIEAKTNEDTNEELDNKKKFINQTFAANVHSLLMNNFFMQSTLGKFSERRIRDIIDILKLKSKDENISKDEDTLKDELVKDGRHYSPREISTTIQTIGEPIIRNKLESMYAEKFGQDIREIEIKKLISEFQESENEIPDKFKNLLNDILIKSSKDYKK